MRGLGRAARAAARLLARADTGAKNQALAAMAAEIRAAGERLLAANRDDVAQAKKDGRDAAFVDRLTLTPALIEQMAAGLEQVAALPDPVGQLSERVRRPTGIEVARMRVPLGVIGIIYESRPNVTADAAALCLKAGNAVILRGGSEAFHSNRAIGRAVAAGLEQAGLNPRSVQVVGNTERESIELLLHHDKEIDLVIPRGGEGLIRFVAQESRIPVVQHYKGVCHVYVDVKADLDMALAIAENAKVQRPGVCNACETVLVHADVAAQFVPRLCARYAECGVEIHGDERVRELGGEAIIPATEGDWSTEYLDLTVAIRVVADLAAAVAHIEQYGSDHTEAIVTADAAAAERFLNEIQSSTVVVNASTRFADGGELGLGAEVGISTTKLHAYGPMGAEGLTTTKFVVRGTGQIRT